MIMSEWRIYMLIIMWMFICLFDVWINSCFRLVTLSCRLCFVAEMYRKELLCVDDLVGSVKKFNVIIVKVVFMFIIFIVCIIIIIMLIILEVMSK